MDEKSESWVPNNYQLKMSLISLASLRLCDYFVHAFPIFWAKNEEVGSSKGEKEFHQIQMNCMCNTLTFLTFGSPSKAKANISNILKCVSSKGMPKPPLSLW